VVVREEREVFTFDADLVICVVVEELTAA